MQVPFCISVSFLYGLPISEANMQAPRHPPVTCSTGQSAGLPCLCLDLSFSGKETLPLPSCLTWPFLPLDFIHNCFLLKYFLTGIN